MKTTKGGMPTPIKKALADGDLTHAIRRYVRTYVGLHGLGQAAKTLGVSRHTLWRFLERGQLGRAVPRAVLGDVGESAEALETARDRLVYQARAREAAKRWMVANTPADEPVPMMHPLPPALEDSLLLLCAAPLTTVTELSCLRRVPASTRREGLEKLAKLGLVDSVAHRLGGLGPRPQQRYFPTEQGIRAAARGGSGTKQFLSEYPVSRQWFRLLSVQRLDAVAVLYHVAALVADADPKEEPVRVDHYRQGPYDVLTTLSGGRSVGVLRQGPTLPSANLRYRLRTVENLSWSQCPSVTLVLSCSDQANRRAVRTLGHTMKHWTFFVATERE